MLTDAGYDETDLLPKVFDRISVKDFGDFGNALESAIQKDDLFMDEERILSVAIAGKQIYPGTCYSM